MKCSLSLSHWLGYENCDVNSEGQKIYNVWPKSEMRKKILEMKDDFSLRIMVKTYRYSLKYKLKYW